MYIYNTLTGKKEKFLPINDGKVGFYLCGPTVYDYFHIGNARPFVIFDVIRRYLEYLGYEVRYVVNLTDVDDKIIKRAKQEGKSVEEIATEYTEAYYEDIKKLGIKSATVNPKATEHISEMVKMIEILLEKGYAYRIDGDIYFDVSRYKEYGKLSGKKIDELVAGARVELVEGKKNPLDFALWKSPKEGEIFWDTPVGKGRPGWHLECSAMSMKYLGEEFDIHAGAEDLIFPHHENEIAQSVCTTGKKFVRYWMHIRFLKIGKEKMAKSLGNYFTAREVVDKYGKEAVRLFFLQKHYRNPINFDDKILYESRRAVSKIGVNYEKIKEFLEGKELDKIENETI
ncbi:cysteine--tRNA ligase, partial [candidate division KSB1 bacterium]